MRRAADRGLRKGVGSAFKQAPPRASGAGAARRVNLLILLKTPQTAAWRPNFGRGTWPLFHFPRRSSVAPQRPDERLAETNNEPGEPRQVPRKLGSTDSDGKWQLGSPTAANHEKTQTVTGHKRRAPMAATDAPNNASNLQAAVQHNADKEKEKAVEANLWTRVSTPCQTWRRSRLLLPR